MNGSFFIKRKTDPFDFLRYTVEKTDAQMQSWLATVRYYYDSIQDELALFKDVPEAEVLEAFPLRPTSCYNYGKTCEFNDFCLAWRNPYTRTNGGEPPPGFMRYFWTPSKVESTKTFVL